MKHALRQPFILTASLAAAIHSTDSVAWLMGGAAPHDILKWIWWVIPGLFMAFAFDVGQIYTASEIRGGNHSFQKYLTFGVFALATYYLQWAYMVRHVPVMPLSEGVRPQWAYTAQLVLDWSIWIVPAFMPLSTILYTLSGSSKSHTNYADVAQVPSTALAVLDEPLPVVVDDGIEVFPVRCACGWAHTYDNQKSATRGLNTHQALHCTLTKVSKNQTTYIEE